MSDEIKSNFENLSIDKTQNPEQKPDALEFDNNMTASGTSTNNDDFSMDMGPSNPNFRPAATNKATTNVPKKKMVMMRRTKDVIEKQELEVKKKATDEARARELQAKTIEQRQKEYQAVRERLGISGTPSTESESGAQNQAPAQNVSGNENGVAVAPESAVSEEEAATATQQLTEAECSKKAESKEESQTETTDKTDTLKTNNTETCKTDQETTKIDQKIEPTSKDTPKSTVCSSQEALQGETTPDSGEAADEAVNEAAELDKLIDQQTGLDSDKKSQKDGVESENDAEITETKTAETMKSDAEVESKAKNESSNDQKPDKLPEKPRGRGTGILSRGNHHNSKPAFVSRNNQRPEGKGLLPLPAFVVNQGNNASLSQNNPSNQYPNYYQSGTNQPGLVQTPQNGMQNPAQNPINNQPGIQQQFSNWKQPEFAPPQNRGDFAGRGNYQSRGRGGMNNSPRSPNPVNTQQWNNGSNQVRPNFQNRGGYQGNQRGAAGQRGRGGHNNYSPRHFTPPNFQNGQTFGNGQNNGSSNRGGSNRGGMNQNYNSGHQGQQGNHAQNNRNNNQVHNSGHNSHNHQNGHSQNNLPSPQVHQNQQMNQQHRGNNAVHSQPPHVHNNHNQNHNQSHNHVTSNGHQNQQNQFRQYEMPGQPPAQPQNFNPPPHQFNANYYQAPNMSAQGARPDAAGQFGNFGPATPPQFQNATFIPAAQNFQVPSTQFQIPSNAMRPDIGATGWGQPPIPSTTANGNMQATTMANQPQLSPSHPPSVQPGNNMNLFQNNMTTMS